MNAATGSELSVKGERVVRCNHCPGVIRRDGQRVHDHHPSCSWWSMRCRICQKPLVGLGASARHPEQAELCFMCGDFLEVESHP